jgi:hypothetical protein
MRGVRTTLGAASRRRQPCRNCRRRSGTPRSGGVPPPSALSQLQALQWRSTERRRLAAVSLVVIAGAAVALRGAAASRRRRRCQTLKRRGGSREHAAATPALVARLTAARRRRSKDAPYVIHTVLRTGNCCCGNGLPGFHMFVIRQPDRNIVWTQAWNGAFVGAGVGGLRIQESGFTTGSWNAVPAGGV